MIDGSYYPVTAICANHLTIV